MKDYCPRAFTINYSDVLNNMVLRFIKDCGQNFSKDANGNYVFSGRNSKTQLKELFSLYLSNEMLEISDLIRKNYDNVVTKHIYMIQSCDPDDNVLAYNDQIDSLLQRYFLTETDIKIDFELFGKIWSDIFDKRFRMKQIGRNYGINFLKHSHLNFKQISNILGQMYSGIILPYKRIRDILVDLGSSYAFNFDGKINDEMRIAIGEVKDFVRQKIRLDWK